MAWPQHTTKDSRNVFIDRAVIATHLDGATRSLRYATGKNRAICDAQLMKDSMRRAIEIVRKVRLTGTIHGDYTFARRKLPG